MPGNPSTQPNSTLTKLCNKYNEAIRQKKSVTIISTLEKQMLLEYMKQKK
jgi:hypothetical protein|tara:strand:- start:715 stop:864 length:150 start_codon:yes stop_codon:yes gene_type:complete